MKPPLTNTTNNNLPPALPPKRSRAPSNKSTSSPPPSSPTAITSTPNQHDHKLSPKIIDRSKSEQTSPIPPVTPVAQQKISPGDVGSVKSEKSETAVVNVEIDLIEELDVSEYLVFKKNEEDGPEVRGGFIDALIVYAAKCNKKGNSNS